MSDAPEVPTSHRDLLDSMTATLSTIGRDGLPQVTATAFYYDAADGLVKLSMNDRRQKIRNLRANPSATLFVLDPDNRLRSLEIRGRVRLEPDPEFAFAAVAGAKHGIDFHVLDAPGDTRSIIVLEPVRIVATDLSR